MFSINKIIKMKYKIKLKVIFWEPQEVLVTYKREEFNQTHLIIT
jgi:hypothetical protein